MRQSQSVLVEASPAASPRHGRKNGSNIFLAIADSLRHSRELAAHRILQEYRHLIAETPGSAPRDSNAPHDSNSTYGESHHVRQ